MNKPNILLLFCCFIGIKSFSQGAYDTLHLYYRINEVRSEENFKRLDSLARHLNGKNNEIKIFGYADFLHSTPYNQLLSQARAEAVKTKLLQSAQPSQFNIKVCKGLGEKFSKSNNSPEGEALQRRVDVVFVRAKQITQSNKDNEKKPDTNPQKNNTKTIEDLSKGESLSLEGLNFEPGRHVVVKDAVPVLTKLLKTMKANKNLKIEIQGHICCLTDGDDGMDIDTREQKLSYNRAKAVYDYLINNRIERERLSYKGFGRSQPKVFPENSPEDEQMNRRVEIMVIDK